MPGVFAASTSRPSAASGTAPSPTNTWASALEEAHSFAPIGGALRERRHRCRQIDPNNCTVRRDSLGKFQNNLNPATAYVEDALTKVRRKRRQSPPTKRSGCTSKNSRTSAHAPTRTSSQAGADLELLR